MVAVSPAADLSGTVVLLGPSGAGTSTAARHVRALKQSPDFTA